MKGGHVRSYKQYFSGELQVLFRKFKEYRSAFFHVKHINSDLIELLDFWRGSSDEREGTRCFGGWRSSTMHFGTRVIADVNAKRISEKTPTSRHLTSVRKTFSWTAGSGRGDNMGQLIVSEFVTLDGVMQAPGAPEEDTEGGFKHGGWQAPFSEKESGSLITRDIVRMDALLLGRKTYDIFAAYWPKATTGDIADKLNTAPKFVASRSRRKLEWNNSTLIQGDLSKEVARIKQKHGEVHVIGSGNLVQTLLRHDLVDRFNIWVYPLLLGTGKRLFGEGTVPAGLRLTSSQAFPRGAILLAYARAGKPEYGDLSVEAERTT